MVGQDPVLRQRFAADKVAALAPFFSALAHPQFTAQAAFILLRVCALPKFNFLCRTLPPRLTSSACAAFDKSVLNAAVSILHLERDSLSALVLQLLAFPTSHGGFGLRRMELAAPAAFLGSLAAAARYMPSPELLSSIPLTGEIERALSVCQIPRLRLPTVGSFLASAARRPPRGLQHLIVTAMEDALVRDVRDNPALASHLLSLRQAGASG